MTEPQRIKKALTDLRKFNNIVFNFNSNKRNNLGLIGFPDWLIITPHLNLVFIEVKIDKDKISEIQQKVINRIASVMGLPNSRVNISIIKTGKEAEQIADKILKGSL